jgi:serine protease
VHSSSMIVRIIGLFVVVISAAVSLERRGVAQVFEMAEPVAHDLDRLHRLKEALDRELPYVPNEVLVRFAPGSEPWQQASALRVLSASVSRNGSRWIGDVLHLRSADIEDPVHAAELLRRQPEVLYAQPNFLRRNKSTPNDTSYSSQWHFQTINMPSAWDINAGGRNDVLVAVLDSGLTTIDNTFIFRIWDGLSFRLFPIPFRKTADFDHARVNPGKEFVLGGGWISTSGTPILFDADGHGSHVAGTIAQQTNNSLGFAGIAYQTTLLPLKVCFSYWDVQMLLGARGIPGIVPPDANGCPDDAQVEALRFAADSGAKVINMSIGGSRGAPALEEALRYAVSRGAFVSIAAGNDAQNGNPTIYPAAYAPGITGVVAVGGVNRRLSRASYSSFGSYVELSAPGGGDGSSADRVWQVTPLQADLRFELFAPRFDHYEANGFQGTSMAAPHVAGVAALLYSQGITNPAAIEAALERFARDLGSPGRDDEFGHGLIDARAALRGLGVAK